MRATLSKSVKVAATLLVMPVAIACGQPGSAGNTSAAGSVMTPTPAAVSDTPTSVAGLTDTGYKAPDGSPLYAECVGNDPATGEPLPLPPVYRTPHPTAPLPPSVTSPDLGERPPDSELPAFDVAAVSPADSTSWQRVATACMGGLSFAVPPGFRALTPLTAGNYQQNAGGEYASASGGIKIDVSYAYSTDKLLARFQNRVVGNGTYLIARNAPATIAGAPAIMDISSEIVGARERYIAISLLSSPQPNHYLSVNAFVQPPFAASDVATVWAFAESIRTAP